MKFFKEMLQYPQEYTYPSSAISSNPSVGTGGAPAPTSATEVAGVGPDGNLHPISTDNAGVVQVSDTSTTPKHVIVDSSALPTGAATAANQATEIASLSTIATNTTGVATAANQASVLARLSGSLVPAAFNEIDLTYISSGNGTGQVGTAIYKLAGSTIKTLTLSYDSSNRLSTVVAS